MPHEMLVPDPDVEDVLVVLGEEIRRRRGARSQEWVGRACGLSQSTISRLESGQAPSLRLERYARVLAVLETGRPLGPWLPATEDTRLLHIRTRNRHRRRGTPGAEVELATLLAEIRLPETIDSMDLADVAKLTSRKARPLRPASRPAAIRHQGSFTSD